MNYPFYITQNTFVLKLNDNLFFLCLKKNRYFQANIECDLKSKTNQLVVNNKFSLKAAQNLIEMGLLTKERSLANNNPFYLGPPARLGLNQDTTFSKNTKFSKPIFILKMFKAVRFASSCIPKLPIDEIGNEIRKLQNRTHAKIFNFSAIKNIVKEWYNLRPFYWKSPSCLFDSLALLHILTREGYSANLIFGIRDDPFEAHSWLQIEDIVINDDFEKIRQFCPIFKI